VPAVVDEDTAISQYDSHSLDDAHAPCSLTRTDNQAESRWCDTSSFSSSWETSPALLESHQAAFVYGLSIRRFAQLAQQRNTPMVSQKISIDRMRIASPCTVGWDRMNGNDQVRFCHQCNLNVYNISEMTGAQVASLIANTEGRICARLYRRADGTVLTSDCPVGLKALRRRVSRIAAAMLTALLSLCSSVAGQNKSQDDKTCSRVAGMKVKRTVLRNSEGSLNGVVLDEVGAVIPGATITLISEGTKESLTFITTTEGEFHFRNVAKGRYSLKIKADNFKNHEVMHIPVNTNEEVRISATLQASGVDSVTVGILVDTQNLVIDIGSTTISGEAIQRIP
jgi:hypothetical protein